jgi:hypothetical protein
MVKKLWMLFILLVVCYGLNLTPGMAATDLNLNDSDMEKVFIFDQWGASFQLPSPKWSFIGDQENDQLRAAMFSFRREAIVDKSKVPVMANVTFIFEQVPQNTVLSSYSAQSLKRAPIVIKNKFTAAEGPITMKNAVGYIGTYRGPDNKDHTLVLVHALSMGKGMQVMMDITSELSPKVINEFYAILRSIKFK